MRRRRFAECGSRRTNGWLSDRVGDRAPTPTTLTNEWKAARSLWFLESDPASRLRPRIRHCETVMPPAKKAAPSAKTIAAPAKTAAIHEGQARSPKATLEWATFPRIFLRIPRSHDNPELLWIDDPEVIGDLVAVGAPVPGHVVAQEVQHRDAEVLEGAVTLVGGGVSVHQPP